MTTGRLVFTNFQVPTAAQVNGYLSDRRLMRFATAATRTTAIPSPEVGMVTWRDNLAGYEYWNGSSWVAFTFTAPAQTVQGHTAATKLSGATLPNTTAADTWTSWASGGTSPAGTQYAVGFSLAGGVDLGGFGAAAAILVEFSLDGGSTVWRRALLGVLAGNSPGAAQLVTGRSCPASSTIHYRWKTTVAIAGGTGTVKPIISWTPTAPTVKLTAAESLWNLGVGGALGTIPAAHRLVTVGIPGTTMRLESGGGSTVIAAWTQDGLPVLACHNRAVPSGALVVIGYSGSVGWVLTEPV